MRSAMLGVIAALLITAVTAATQAQTKAFSIQEANVSSSRNTTEQAPPRARQNETAAEQNISTAAPYGPERHFREPQESFPKEVLRAAAAEIHNGAASLRFQADRVAEKTEEAVTASKRGLEKLVQRVKKNSINLTRAVRRTFAPAADR